MLGGGKGHSEAGQEARDESPQGAQKEGGGNFDANSDFFPK